MPIYEYACAACEREFEVEQRITDAPLKSCPKCRSRRVKRLISRTSFALKGGGWYADGYGSSPGAAKSGESSESGASEAPAGSDASKPTEKSDAPKKSEAGASKDKKAVA